MFVKKVCDGGVVCSAQVDQDPSSKTPPGTVCGSIAMETIRPVDIFNPGGLSVTPTQWCWVKVRFCCVVKKKQKDPGEILYRRSEVKNPWANVWTLYFHVVFFIKGKQVLWNFFFTHCGIAKKS